VFLNAETTQLSQLAVHKRSFLGTAPKKASQFNGAELHILCSVDQVGIRPRAWRAGSDLTRPLQGEKSARHQQNRRRSGDFRDASLISFIFFCRAWRKSGSSAVVHMKAHDVFHFAQSIL
jgi:hypothetical protein